jgi:hypothetical protein
MKQRLLDSQPSLFPHLAVPWGVFSDLSARRPWAVGMAAVPMPIPLAELTAYLQLAGIARSDWSWIQWCVAILDAEWLRLVRKSTPPPKGAPRGNDRPDPPRH